MGLAKGITRNTFYVFASQIVQKLVNVGFIAGSARLLGAKGYGDYVLVSTMVIVATTIANFGMRPMIIRMVSREKDRAASLLSNVLAVRVGSAGLVYLLLIAFAYLAGYPAEIRTLVLIGGMAILFNTMQDALDSVLIGFERMRVLGIFIVLSAILFTTTGIAVLWLGLGLRWLFSVNVAVEALFVLISGFFIWTRLARFGLSVDFAVVKAVLVGCFPFFIALLFGFTDTKVDVLMLSLVPGPMPSDLAIGYYGPAHSILMTILLLPRSLNMALVPVVSQKIYVDQDAVRNLIENSTKFIMITISLPLILLTTLFSEQVVGIVLGPKFLETATALAILGWAYAFQAINLPSHSVLGSTKELRYFLPMLAASFVLNIVLDFILIPYFSFRGAAMGSVIVLAAGFFGRFYFLGKILGTRWSAALPYLRLFVILGVTLGAAYLLKPHVPWLLLAAVVAVLYVGLLFAFRTIEKEEWSFVAGLMGRRLGIRRGAA
jgi:O-antigen/teichoic acid export membrane protein